MRILVFGDSIAQGFFDEKGGWANRLREHYDKILIKEKDLSQPTVFNLGVSGDTAEALLKRLENEIVARIWPGEEFVFIISIGINDTIYVEEKTDSDPDKYKTQLGQFLYICKKYSKKILFVSLFPVEDVMLQPIPWEDTGKCYSTERIKLFNNVLQDFCRDNNLPIVGLFEEFKKLPNLSDVFYDGIHPNEKGHTIIADLVIENLRKVI